MLLFCTRKEPPGRRNIPVFAPQEIEYEALLIDSTIEIRPASCDLDVSLVNAPRPADLMSVAIPSFLKLRDEVLNESAG